MSDPSIGAVASSAPLAINEDPMMTNPTGNETFACVDPSSDGVASAGGAGTRALVERFGGHQGASGTGAVPEEPETPGPSCNNDALATVATCGAAVIATATTGGALAVFTGIGCLAAVEGYAECLNQESASKGSR